MTFSNDFMTQNVRERHFNDLYRRFTVSIDISLSLSWSSKSLTWICDVKMSITTSWDYDFRCHSIITPSLALVILWHAATTAPHAKKVLDACLYKKVKKESCMNRIGRKDVKRICKCEIAIYLFLVNSYLVLITNWVRVCVCVCVCERESARECVYMWLNWEEKKVHSTCLIKSTCTREKADGKHA